MKLLCWWVCAPALAAVLLGCQTPEPKKIDFQLTSDVLADGPPKAAGEAIETLDQMESHPEINIDPETAVGYEELTSDVRELYGPQPRVVSLNDVIQQTLAHNRGIKIEGYTLEVAEFSVPVSKSIYDLAIEGTAGAAKEKNPGGFTPEFLVLAADNPFNTTSEFTLTRTRNFALSGTQLLPTGAEFQLEYALSRFFVDPISGGFNSSGNFVSSRENPLYTQALTLTLTQPLLRGFGPAITNADIHIAQLDFDASAANFETEVQDQVSEALNQYWDLLFEVNRYDVVVIAYTAALDLLRINNAKVAAGVMAQTEALQAEASVAERKEAVIRERQLVRDAEDRLKQLMFFQEDTPDWDLELFPSQPLTWREHRFDSDAVLAEALDKRSEIRAAAKFVQIRDKQVFQARDARKPELGLQGTAGIVGRGGGGNAAFDDLETADFNNFSIGMRFAYPLQNRRARFAYSQSLSEQQQSIEQYQLQRDAVAFEVRAAIRELETARERIDITRVRVTSEQANLEAERKRYEVGVSTSFEVLEFQEDLFFAQEAYVRAIVDYNKATISLERARGTILHTYGIQFAGEEPENEETQETQEMFPIGFD